MDEFMTARYVFKIDLVYKNTRWIVTNVVRHSGCLILYYNFFPAVSRMIRVLIFIYSFLVYTLAPSSFLVPILSHRYDVNWILKFSLANLFRFTRSSLTNYMKRNTKCQPCFISFFLNVSLYLYDACKLMRAPKKLVSSNWFHAT
jgi:hypothetical protein